MEKNIGNSLQWKGANLDFGALGFRTLNLDPKLLMCVRVWALAVSTQVSIV